MRSFNRVLFLVIFPLLLIAFTSSGFSSEFFRLRDTFGDWDVRHVYNEETLHYRFSDAKTFLIREDELKLPCQINRTKDGQFEFRFKYGFGQWGDRGVLGDWVTKIVIGIGEQKFNFKDAAGMKVHEFITPVDAVFLNALANTNSPATVQIYVDDKFSETVLLPVKGSSAALRWLRVWPSALQ